MKVLGTEQGRVHEGLRRLTKKQKSGGPRKVWRPEETRGSRVRLRVGQACGLDQRGERTKDRMGQGLKGGRINQKLVRVARVKCLR